MLELNSELREIYLEPRGIAHRSRTGDQIRRLAWQFDQLDVSRGDVHVKVFGGAELSGSERPQSRPIGKPNSAAAIEVLGAEGFIRTARGARIGITFWSAKLRVGALAHPLLPNCPTDLTAEKRLVTGRRYVDFSIRQLAWQFDQLDVSRRQVHVKVFGGAEVVGIGAAAKPAVGTIE
jgi:chemotaxis receptor (MCP) glutamine deamidase CheD